MTNADRIRSMTDEELALAIGCPYGECVLDDEKFEEWGCSNCTFDWLKQEIPAPPQKDPLCFSCEHGQNGAVDDFATCYCPHHG